MGEQISKFTRTSVTLSDLDLAKLIGSEDADTRAEAEAAADRIAAPARWNEIPPHVAALVADVLREAKIEGRLIHRTEMISVCRYCGARTTWEKSKRRRRDFEAKLSGREFAYRFVTIKGHISVGGCQDCVDRALPALRAELTRFPVELPRILWTEGAPIYRRWDRCRCKKCEWSGHEGQLGKLPAVMQGEYPGKCPSCGAERSPFGANPFEHLDGFDVAEAKEPRNG